MCTRVHTTGKTNTTPRTRNNGRDDGRREREKRRRRRRDNPDEDREEEPKEKREADRKEKKKGFGKNTISVCIQKKNRNQIATTYTDAHTERATETGI